MSPSTRLFLGLASLLPTAALASLPWLAEVAASRPNPEELILASLALSLTGIGAVLMFVWIAGGLDRSGLWRLGWMLALTLYGVVTAPLFWWLYVRTAPASPASGSTPRWTG